MITMLYTWACISEDWLERYVGQGPVCSSIFPCIRTHTTVSGLQGTCISNNAVMMCGVFIQVVFSPMRCNGLGLSDGEVMERLWSYLRRFSRMTKEMRPAHRIDILSHALLFYGFKTKQKFGKHFLWLSYCKVHFFCGLLVCIRYTSGSPLEES